MTIVIVHGIGGKSGDHWEQWLHDQLIREGHTVIMPSLPDADHPDRSTWLSHLEQLVHPIPPEELVIVGHSLGVTAALDVVETISGKAKALISISGFANDYASELNTAYLSKKAIDLSKVKEHLEKVFVFYGDDDPYVPQEVLQGLADGLGVRPTIIPHGGHLNTAAGFTTFPQLLSIITHLA